jgi:hypothetical protein
LARRVAGEICEKPAQPNAEIAAISAPQPEIKADRAIDATGLVLYGAAAQKHG